MQLRSQGEGAAHDDEQIAADARVRSVARTVCVGRRGSGILGRRCPSLAVAETSALPSGSGPAPGTGPKWLASYRRGLIITDSVIIVAVVLTSQALRFNDSTRVVLDGFGSVSYWSISAVLSCLWLAAIGINGSWDRNILGAGPSEYGRIIRASFFLFGFVAIVSYLTRAEIARSYLAIALPLGLFGLLGGRWVWRRLLVEYRSTGSHLRSVLVVGGTTSSASLANRLRNAPAAGYRVAGLCLPGGPQAWSDQGDAVEDGFPVVGDLTDVVGAIRRCQRGHGGGRVIGGVRIRRDQGARLAARGFRRGAGARPRAD